MRCTRLASFHKTVSAHESLCVVFVQERLLKISESHFFQRLMLLSDFDETSSNATGDAIASDNTTPDGVALVSPCSRAPWEQIHLKLCVKRTAVETDLRTRTTKHGLKSKRKA